MDWWQSSQVEHKILALSSDWISWDESFMAPCLSSPTILPFLIKHSDLGVKNATKEAGITFSIFILNHWFVFVGVVHNNEDMKKDLS